MGEESIDLVGDIFWNRWDSIGTSWMRILLEKSYNLQPPNTKGKKEYSYTHLKESGGSSSKIA